MFVDNCGTNANASIFFNPDLLDNESSVEEAEYLKWLGKYLQIKENEKLPGQAKKIRSIYWGYFLDLLGFYLLRIPREENTSVKKKLLQKLSLRLNKIVYDPDFLPTDYYFFPLQVTHDSQLLIHSNLSNELGIIEAHQIAVEENFILLVKIHPAENDPWQIKKILELRRKLKFKLVTGNTFGLVEKAKKIITINSTVGLEALILKKPVLFLGKTYYSHLDCERLKKYLLRYLIELDYFGKDSVEKSIVCQILELKT